jgi:hypothetical protein
MRGSLATLVFVLTIVIATAFLFIAVTGIMILWATGDHVVAHVR